MSATIISPKELAAMLGVTQRHLRRLADDGTLIRTPEGDYLATESVRSYCDKLRAGGGGPAEYQEAKLREKNAKARLAELEVEEREGKLLTLEHVCRVNGEIFTALVARLCNLPASLAGICHEQPAEFIEARFSDAIRSALKEVAKMDFMPKAGVAKAPDGQG